MIPRTNLVRPMKRQAYPLKMTRSDSERCTKRSGASLLRSQNVYPLRAARVSERNPNEEGRERGRDPEGVLLIDEDAVGNVLLPALAEQLERRELLLAEGREQVAVAHHYQELISSCFRAARDGRKGPYC